MTAVENGNGLRLPPRCWAWSFWRGPRGSRFTCTASAKPRRRRSPPGSTALEEPEQFLAENVIEYGGKKYRRNSYVKAILCIGVDRSGLGEKTTTGFGGQSDGLFLLAQDTARNTVKILMIPRDTLTRITLTDLSGNVLGKDVQHLTLAYAYGDGRELSCEYTVEAVSELLGGLTIDHYMAVDTDSHFRAQRRRGRGHGDH